MESRNWYIVHTLTAAKQAGKQAKAVPGCRKLIQAVPIQEKSVLVVLVAEKKKKEPGGGRGHTFTINRAENEKPNERNKWNGTERSMDE